MRPSASAVFMLITSSYLVGCSTGRSEGLVTIQNLIDVAARTAEQISYIWAVYDQSTIGELPEEINRRQMMFRCERYNSGRLPIGQRIAKNNHCLGVLGGRPRQRPCRVPRLAAASRAMGASPVSAFECC